MPEVRSEEPAKDRSEVLVKDRSKARLEAGALLPGVAGVCLFMLLLSLLNVFGALQGAFGAGPGRYGVLVVCTLLVAGVFGLLRMRRWGWALVVGGCLALSLGDIFFFLRAGHQPFFAVRATFELVFFLYLSRTEVRDRLR